MSDTGINIELSYDQADLVVLQLLQSALERNIQEYFDKVRVFDSRKEHRRLIKSLHRSIAYFMAHDEFVEYMQEIEWPSDINVNPYKW